MNHYAIHDFPRIPVYLSLAFLFSLSTSPLLDLYSVLQIPPTASPSEILSAWNTAVNDFESDIDNFTDLNLRKRTIGLLGTTLRILLHPTDRLLYDVYRSMTLRPLSFTKPTHDLPSRHVTLLRHRMIWYPLRWALVEAALQCERLRRGPI